MAKCTKCGTNFVGTPEIQPTDGLCHYCERDKLIDALDMHRDDFQRIIALGPSDEVIGICNRAVVAIEQTVPVVVQRDRYRSERATLRRALAVLVGADGAKELDDMELALRTVPGIESDRIAALNAIHALRDTLDR